MENRPPTTCNKPTVAKVRPVKKLQTGKVHYGLVEKAIHIKMLRKRISDLVQRAANMNSLGGCGSALRRHPVTTRHFTETTHGSHLARLLSRLFQTSQSKGSLQTVFQRTLVEIDGLLTEYIEEQLRSSREHNERQLEDLTVVFKQLLRQKECTYQEEILQLQCRINYIQEELSASRKSSEIFQQQLANAKSILAERSQEMGRTIKEVTDLRHEVDQLRLYIRENKLVMQDSRGFHHELNRQKRINKEILKEFSKIENERDEFRWELNNSLMKIRNSNRQRHQAIEAELNEVEENFVL